MVLDGLRLVWGVLGAVLKGFLGGLGDVVKGLRLSGAGLGRSLARMGDLEAALKGFGTALGSKPSL